MIVYIVKTTNGHTIGLSEKTYEIWRSLGGQAAIDSTFLFDKEFPLDWIKKEDDDEDFH